MTPDRFDHPTCCPDVKHHIIWLVPCRNDKDVKTPGWHMGQEKSIPVRYCMFCGKKLVTDIPLLANKK